MMKEAVIFNIISFVVNALNSVVNIINHIDLIIFHNKHVRSNSDTDILIQSQIEICVR